MEIDTCWYKSKCQEKCTQNCIRYKLMYSLYRQSQLPEAMWNYKELTCFDEDYEEFKRLSEISKDMIDFTRNGHNLYIYSHNSGNGKTSWAVRLMFCYFDKMWHKSCFDCKALFVNVPNFLYNCKRSISQELKGFEDLCNLISSVDLVVWDDIAESNATSYEHQILLQYIDGRINAEKSNIYTSNKDFEELKVAVGDRLASRVYNCSEKILFVEEDKRGMC